MSLCLTRPVISDFGRYFIKASITFSIHLAFFFWPFRKWNVKLTNQCWWISRKQRSSSQKMFVYSSWPLSEAGFSWRLCDLWGRQANWRNTKIIFLGVNFKNYFIFFKYIKIVLQANVKDVLCSLKEKKYCLAWEAPLRKVLLPTHDCWKHSYPDFLICYLFSKWMFSVHHPCFLCFLSVDLVDLVGCTNWQLMLIDN